MLGMHPSPGQYDVLWALAGRDPFEWGVEYQQYVLAIGQGGGKNTYIVAPFMGYLAYKIANMRDPHAYFSRFYDAPLDRQTKFEVSNSSLVTERQAKNVHFNKMVGLIRRCMTRDGSANWFEKFAGMDIRQSFGDIKDKSITIPTGPGMGPIVLHSFDSTPTAPEGLNLIAAIMDEPSRANSAASYADAELLWRVIIGNLNTRFGRSVGKALAFSYLNNSEWDFTNTLLTQFDAQEREGLPKLIFGTRKASWDTNPNIKRTDESVDRDYRNDPSDARARYECIKGAAKEGFYQPNPEKPRECFYELQPKVVYGHKVVERSVLHPVTRETEVKRYVALDIESIQGDNKARMWAFDPAEKYDAFVLKGGYVETMDERRDELFIDNHRELVVINRRPVIDVCLVWAPRDGLSVDYLNVGEVIGLLLDKFPGSRSVVSDKWNSVKLSQEIIARGVHSETLGFSAAQQLRLYLKLRWMMWNNIPQIMYDAGHVLSRRGVTKSVGEWNTIEHERLLRLNGNKIDHPADGGKDFADVDAILCNILTDMEAQQMSAGNGMDMLTDARMLSLAERFMQERQAARNAGVEPRDMADRLASVLSLTPNEVRRLQEFVDEAFPGV